MSTKNLLLRAVCFAQTSNRYHSCRNIVNSTCNKESLFQSSHIFEKPSNGVYITSASARFKNSRSKQYAVAKRLERELPEVRDEDLTETHVLGSGPGGQATNKTHNAVVLRHVPTGIIVKSHLTRSVEKNRADALKRLRHKLDAHLHGDESALARHKVKRQEQKQHAKNRNYARMEKLRAFKEREGLNNEKGDKRLSREISNENSVNDTEIQEVTNENSVNDTETQVVSNENSVNNSETSDKKRVNRESES